MINYEKVWVNGYNLELIKSLKLEININEYIVLNLIGILKNEVKDSDIVLMINNKIIEVYYVENESIILFYGIVINIEINVKFDVYMLNIEVKSMLYLMDI